MINKKAENKLSSSITNMSFLKTEPESTNNLNQNINLENINIKQKEVDEIILKYLNLKTKLNELWNKFE